MYPTTPDDRRSPRFRAAHQRGVTVVAVVVSVLVVASAAWACNPDRHTYLSDTSAPATCYTTPTTNAVGLNFRCFENLSLEYNPGVGVTAVPAGQVIPLKGGCDSLSEIAPFPPCSSGTGKVYLDTATYDPSDGIYSPLVPRENPIEPNPSSRVGGNASQNPQTTCNASDTYVSTGSANGVSGADMTAPTSLLEATGTAIIPTNAPLGLHKICADYSLSRMWDLILIV